MKHPGAGRPGYRPPDLGNRNGQLIGNFVRGVSKAVDLPGIARAGSAIRIEHSLNFEEWRAFFVEFRARERRPDIGDARQIRVGLKESGMMMSRDWPTTSCDVKPKMRWQPPFQKRMTPVWSA
jgi:hypothetical protein